MSLTNVLILLNVLAFAAELALGPGFIAEFTLWPTANPQFHWYQFLTYAFLHGSLAHLGFNMFALWMFGSTIEHRLGPSQYLTLYFVAALMGAAVQEFAFYVQHVVDVPSLGASAAVFGLLLAFGVYFPLEKVFFIFLPIPISAWLFVLIYAGAELFFGLTGIQPGVGHWAHLGGALGAGLLILYWWATRVIQ